MRKLERVMLIDDDVNTNFYNKILLEQSNLVEDIVIFQQAMEALAYLKNDGQNVSLILLDINMPVMNGWEFLEAYEKLDTKLKETLVVVMLTSSVNKEDHERASKIKSIKRFLSKPISPEDINDLVGLLEADTANV